MGTRNVLLVGYGAMIGLLIVSALQAYRIQQSASEQSAEIYHRYVKEEEILSRCRRNLFVGGIYARDFLLSTKPDRASTYRAQLGKLKLESQKALEELGELPGPAPSASPLTVKTLEYWDALESIAGWTVEASAKLGFDFVQREITPRRNAAGDLAREFRDARQNALKNSELEFSRSRRSARLWLFLMVGLCLLFGVAVAYHSLAHSEHLERETARQYEQLEQLSGRLLEVQEAERKQISRDLHDEIGQTLTALGIEVAQAHTLLKAGAPGAEARLERARALTAKTVQTVRDISLLLRPPLLDDLGLREALQWHVDDFTRRTSILSSFREEGLQDALPDSHKICIYRIVQEALHNCEAHAVASTVQVSIHQTPQQLILEIEDDGRGFATDGKRGQARAGGLGIPGMRERATLLGGTLHLDSAAGGGTRVRLSLPLSLKPSSTSLPDGHEERRT
jgi:signal transduction histidine kinase